MIIDGDRLLARLAATTATARRISGYAYADTSIRLDNRGWTATAWLNGGNYVSAQGATTDAAFDGLEATLAERDPAVGWATLGVKHSEVA